jgi:putative aldouronate transport system permease protein
MSIGFEPIFVLQNPAVYEVSDVISTYIYRIGLLGGRFSITTAMGLFDSLVGLILVVSANKIARKFGQELW